MSVFDGGSGAVRKPAFFFVFLLHSGGVRIDSHR